jgi:hypothetical protein
MFLGLSFFGWAILIAAYVPVALLLVWMAHRFGWRSKAFALTAMLISIPFVAAIGEAAYVEYNWRALCATAKTEVKRKVVVEGFYDDGFRYAGWAVLRDGKNGFRFVEWKDKEGRVWRDESFTEPKVTRVRIEKPTARYHWHMAPFSTPVSHLIERRDDTIVDTQTGEVIARHIAGRLHRRYALREADSSDYSERTKKNVEDTDGTLITNSGDLSGGTAKTASYARSVHKPLMIVGLEETSLRQESTATTRCPSRWDTPGREPFELEGGRQECELDYYPPVSDVVATHYGVPNALHG